MGSVPLPEELFAPRMSWRPDADLPVVERFGGYEIFGCVGRGGMAEILLARRASAAKGTRPVVIKRVLPEIAGDLGIVTMFRDEARLVMSLDHPNICRIDDVGQVDGRPYMAMEWIHGASLADMIGAATSRGEELPASAVARIIEDVARALDYAHRAADKQGRPLQLVHRDVSPQNIMVGFDGRVLLLDFGLAKASTQTYKTAAGVVKGKIAYLAPEQWQGAVLDARTDVFALGLCLYESLTDHILYNRKQPIETMEAVMNEPPPDPRSYRPDLDRRFTEIVEVSLQKAPARRFASAAAMADALKPLAVGPDGQLRALMKTLFPADADLGPELGLRAKLQPPASSNAQQLPPLPPGIAGGDRAQPSSMASISQAVRNMHGGHRTLWITLALIAAAIGGVLYAMGWRFR